MPARLIDVTASHKVTLEDISRTGARIASPEPLELALGEAVILQWFGFEHFGEIVWRFGNRAGISFEGMLADPELLDTRRLQDRMQGVGGESYLQRQAALEWVRGTGG